MDQAVSHAGNVGLLTPTLDCEEWKPHTWHPSRLPITPPSEKNLEYFDSSSNAACAGTLGANFAREPLVAVIGVGYVGTHLVDSFSSTYQVIGFDTSERRVEQLEGEFCHKERVTFTSCRDDLRQASHFLISVPTLLRADKTIDSSYLEAALETVSTYAHPGSTVVIESSVAVGMTRNLLGPIAAARGFFAGMSPERVDPGRTQPPMRSIPKVISGLEDVVPGSLDAIARLYQPIFDQIIQVSRPEVAEMTKLYENCQRMMNIAFANEMADACMTQNIDPYEVCRAAASKPFGYMPYTPSVGVGGHCIPVNPYYLLSNCEFPLLQAATEKMWQRPSVIAQRVISNLCGASEDRMLTVLSPRPRVLVAGLAFKAGQSVLSNSPGLQLARELMRSDEIDVLYADRLVAQAAVPDVRRLPDEQWTTEILGGFDMIIVTFKQTGTDFNILDSLKGVTVKFWCQ